MAEVIMPKMGDQMAEGRIVSWRKHEGDSVQKGEALAEIETDKANADVEAEESGTLTRILVKEGDTVPVGAPIAMIGDGAAGGRAAPRQGGQAPARPAESQAAAPAGQREDTAPNREAAPAHPQRPAPPAAAPAHEEAAPDKGERVKASPLARRLAAEHGVDLGQIKGTGPGGRIERRDVEQFRSAAAAPAAAPPAAPGPAEPAVATAEQTYEDRELTRMRQLIARNLTVSKPGAPHIYLTVDVEMDAALALRKQLNDLVGSDERARISVNDLVHKAAALALRAFPELNAWFLNEQPQKIRYFKRVDLGFAVQTEDGLLVPVIRAADTKSLTQLARESKELHEKMRAGKRSPNDLTGGTFSVSSLGMFGIDEFQAVLNPPQAGILAIGAAAPKAVVRDDQVVARTMMRATISADHRVVDGVYSARYLQEFKRLLESPLSLVL